MLRKASEIRADLRKDMAPDAQEALRNKKIALRFDHCGLCGSELQFRHRHELGQTIIEEGECRHCKSPIEPRRYKLC